MVEVGGREKGHVLYDVSGGIVSRRDWVRLGCSRCGGGGEAWNGDDLVTCYDCKGAGGWWLSENDRLAEYPGGKFCGSAPGGVARRN